MEDEEFYGKCWIMGYFVLKVIDCRYKARIGTYLVSSITEALGMDKFTSNLEKAKTFNYIDYDEAEKIQKFYYKYMGTKMEIVKIKAKECIKYKFIRRIMNV